MTLWSIAIVVLLALALAVFRVFEQHQVAKRMAITSANGIAALERVQLGGTDQWIQIRGWDQHKPVLLFLHSGPGFPEMPFSYVNAELEKEFVVVQWDQRGAGKSYSTALDQRSMNVEQFVSDTRELCELLGHRFGGKIFLVAHSWGTLIGTLTASRYPELFRAYVAIGQVVDPPESERLAYQFAVEKAGEVQNDKAVIDLKKLGEPPYKRVADYEKMKTWVARFSDQPRYQPSPARFAWLAFCSPAYSWHDLVNIPLGMRFSFSELWREAFYQTNLAKQAPRIEVPFYLLEGRHDYTVTVTAAMAERYFDRIDAPQGKQVVWFENSAHWPQLTEPDKFNAALGEIARKTPP